ncbi:MAG: Sip1-related alpha-galactosidase [Eubacteriales bacterium]
MGEIKVFFHGGNSLTVENGVRNVQAGSYTACFASYSGDDELDSECGAEIEVTPKDAERYMADVRHSEFWCSPRFDGTDAGVDYDGLDEVQYFVCLGKNGKYTAIVPVVSEDYKCVLVGRGDKLFAKLFSWKRGMKVCDCLAYVTAEGDDPFELTEGCVRCALELLGRGDVMRKDKRYPEVFEYLGWCSWDALQIRVSEDGIRRKCEEFKAKNIPVKWAIIDDMWAEITEFPGNYTTRGEMFSLMHSSHMYDFEASRDRFPDGLAHTVGMIHSYGMKVGMWHPTTGYWCGLDPDGKAYEKLRDYTYTTPDGKIIGAYSENGAFGYFGTIHSFFKKCGTDFVKVDNQSMTRRFYKGVDSVGRVTRSWHRGLEASVGLHFDNAMINCMGMASEDMWNRFYSSVCRCSDDFQPEDRAWFSKHILQCAYNSVLQGQFYWSDFDMWWTDDTQAQKNSLLRAVSGGPIYVSDEIGRSRAEVLKPLAFDDGKILRCDMCGLPSLDCLTSDPETSGRALKIQNVICSAAGDFGFVAAFNIDRNGGAVSGKVRVSDVAELKKCAENGEKFVIYEHFSREFVITDACGEVEFTLSDCDDFRLFVIIPYIGNFAPIGRSDKFISPAAITQKIGERVTLYEDGEYSYIKDGRLYTE